MTATGNELVTLRQLKYYGGGHLKINGDGFLLGSDSKDIADSYEAHVGNVRFENSLPSDQGFHENWNQISLTVDGKDPNTPAMLMVQGATDDGPRGQISMNVDGNNTYLLLHAFRISEDAYRIVSSRPNTRTAFSIQKLSSSFQAGTGYTYDVVDEMEFAASQTDFLSYLNID